MAKTDLLIIGGSGFIGAKGVESAIRVGYSVAYTYSSRDMHLPALAFPLNLQAPGAVEDCVAATQPHTIIYCAVPRAGSGQELHEAVSVEGVQRLLAALDPAKQQKVIFVSTNAVFSGRAGPYAEDATPDPEGRQDRYRLYATTRAKGEQIALASWPNTIVVRTADVNGRDIHGQLNPRLLNLVEQLQAGRSVPRYCHAYISPTGVDNLVAGLLEISTPAFDYRGILHIAGSEPISYYDFARCVARQLKLDERLITADASQAWDISLQTSYTQNLLKTRLMNVSEQLVAIFT